jgi:hypothetical protein
VTEKFIFFYAISSRKDYTCKKEGSRALNLDSLKKASEGRETSEAW